MGEQGLELRRGLGAEVSLNDLRPDIVIEVYNDAGLALAYKVTPCSVPSTSIEVALAGAALGSVWVMRPNVTLVSSSGVLPAQQLSIGVLRDLGDEGSGPERDVGIALVELFAYVEDVLSSYQDKVANEAYLHADWHEDTSLLRIRLDADLRPALCLIVDGRCAYVVVVGPDTDEASVSFGDGAVGDRPPTGSEMISASYRRGGGPNGNLALSGLRLEKPFVVIVTGGAGTTARRFC